MNLFEFLFAFGAVFGITGIHFLWLRFVYSLENADEQTQTNTQNFEEQRIT